VFFDPGPSVVKDVVASLVATVVRSGSFVVLTEDPARSDSDILPPVPSSVVVVSEFSTERESSCVEPVSSVVEFSTEVPSSIEELCSSECP